MLRFAMCNEAFADMGFSDACREVAAAGYQGIEIAPFTLAPSPADVNSARRHELRAMMRDAGLAFVGLHWLMVSPAGLHATAGDRVLRERSWDHLRALVDLCGDLASGPSVMVFGSPKQRGTTGGSSPAEAVQRFEDGLRALAAHAESRRVTILVEALPANQCDVVQSLEEAAAMVRDINHPAIQTMFDTHNAVDEPEPHAALIERYFPLIRHVHVNEMDGRYPGTGDYDFRSVLKTLERLDYTGWISLEVFDFKPNPVIIAREALHYLQSIL